MSKSEEINCVHCADAATRASFLPLQVHHYEAPHECLQGASVHGREEKCALSKVYSECPFLRSCGTIIYFTNIVKQYATRIPEIRVFHHHLHFGVLDPAARNQPWVKSDYIQDTKYPYCKSESRGNLHFTTETNDDSLLQTLQAGERKFVLLQKWKDTREHHQIEEALHYVITDKVSI